MLDPADLAVADDHVRAALEDRAHEPGDVRAVVLVVGVGVDDHVGAELQRGVDARLEARGQALVVGQAHEVIDAVRARDRDRLVGRAVVDHEPLDDVEALHLARQVRERLRELLCLVEAGDLDDELHCRRLPRLGSRQYPKAQVTVLAPSVHRAGAGGRHGQG